MVNKNENQTELPSARHLARVLPIAFQHPANFTCWRNKKAVSQFLVLAAFFLLPLVADASPVVFEGGAHLGTEDLGGSTNNLFAQPLGFNVAKRRRDHDIQYWRNRPPELYSARHLQRTHQSWPNLYGAQFSFHPGRCFPIYSYWQPNRPNVHSDADGAQNITLHGVNYFITFAPPTSVTPGQMATFSATLTPGSPVPEPTTILLFGTGLTAIVIKVRGRRKAASKL